MAKEVIGKIKLQLEAGKANPAPPVGRRKLDGMPEEGFSLAGGVVIRHKSSPKALKPPFIFSCGTSVKRIWADLPS